MLRIEIIVNETRMEKGNHISPQFDPTPLLFGVWMEDYARMRPYYWRLYFVFIHFLHRFDSYEFTSPIFGVVADVCVWWCDWCVRYNERENLPLCIYMIDKAMSSGYDMEWNGWNWRGYSYEVIVVEDNSPDGTYEVAVELRVWLCIWWDVME